MPEGGSAGHIPEEREFSNMLGLRECRSMTDPIIRTQRSLTGCERRGCISSLVSSLLCPLLERAVPPMVRLSSLLVLFYGTQRIYTYTYIRKLSLLPSSPYALPFLVPRTNPDDQADRAGDTLSGKSGRRTKEGAPAMLPHLLSSCCVLRLPSASRTNPTSRASRPAVPRRH